MRPQNGQRTSLESKRKEPRQYVFEPRQSTPLSNENTDVWVMWMGSTDPLTRCTAAGHDVESTSRGGVNPDWASIFGRTSPGPPAGSGLHHESACHSRSTGTLHLQLETAVFWNKNPADGPDSQAVAQGVSYSTSVYLRNARFKSLALLTTHKESAVDICESFSALLSQHNAPTVAELGRQRACQKSRPYAMKKCLL